MTHPASLVAELVRGPLAPDHAEALMTAVMRGDLADTQVAAALGALEARGAEAGELRGFARALIARMVPIEAPEDALDTAGTGGSGQATLNTSTLAGVVAAAAGAPVAKHGNRSASGNCGSLDVLEALGAATDLSPEQSAALLTEHRFTFVNARSHHPGLGRLGPLRKTLGFRTVFNLLGPMLNPAGVRRQLLGLSRPEAGPALARALADMGHTHAWVVAGPDRLDELALGGESRVWEVRDGAVECFSVDPADYALSPPDPAALAGGDASHNAARFLAILDGSDRGAAHDHVALNAGAALVVGGRAAALDEGITQAVTALESGAALDLFSRWRQATLDMTDPHRGQERRA
ncbi:MAG: anthranilate phosphoribosyltransferase [Myxococcota bacterium]